MMYADPSSRSPRPRPPIRFPFQRPRRLTRRHLLLSVILCLVILSGIIGGWSTGVFTSHAADPLTSDPANMTFQQFLNEGRQDSTYRGPVILPSNVAPPPGKGSQHYADYANLPPSAEPATMQPLSAPLSSTFLADSVGATALDLNGSDGRLEVQLQPGSLDLSNATVSSGGSPVGALSAHLVQVHGHYMSKTSVLGSYQLQVVDSLGKVVTGIVMHAPATIIYHYQLSELAGLGIDPGHVLLTWPTLIAAALQAKQPATGLTIPMQNDPVAHTLTAQSMVLDPSPFDSSSTPANQSLPALHLASVQGNSGQSSYSYDSSGNRTVQVTLPLHTGSFTSQSSTASGCTSSSVTPCFEIDSKTYQYNAVSSSTFYDSLGRAVETRTPGPRSGDDTLVITIYNDQAHSVWQSVPFEITHGSGWVDPNGVTDYQGIAPGGTVTFYDALGRSIVTQDPLYGSSQEPGIACSTTLSGTYTACTNYGLGTVSGDSNTYATDTAVDPNKHVSISYNDALGRTVYAQFDSGLYGGTLTLNEQKTIQYNVLNEPTSVKVDDKAPQTSQTITSVTTTAQYDDLGRLTQVADPDRGTHTYTLDANGRVKTNVSGTRTIGYNFDLLYRLGCVQDAAPTINATGACSAGNQYVQNTYDTNKLTVSGTTDYPKGQLTQSVSNTYLTGAPGGDTVTTTQSYEHDARGRLQAAQLQFGTLPSSWGITTALPSYLAQYTYTDADQLYSTTTSTTPSGQGYSTSQIYDPTIGSLTGLSNQAMATSANLATLVYNARAQVDTINFQTTTGSALASDQFGYDADLRPTSATATWQPGSGSSGTMFSQNRVYDPASNVLSLATTQTAVPGQSGSGGSESQNFCYDEQNHLVWAGNSGSQPGAGNGICGTATLSNSLSGASYTNNYVYTHLGQLWQGPLNGSGSQQQYLYCNSQPHELTGLYGTSATCSNKTGQVYASSYDSWGNVTSRTYSGTTATLTYDLLDHFVSWNAGSQSKDLSVYDASGTRVLRRTTTSSGTTMTVYAFGLEEHTYFNAGGHKSDLYYYNLGGRLLGALDNTGKTTFYLTDALGSVLASFNSVAQSAAIKGNQVYGPYGNSRDMQGSINTAKGYTGQYTDSVSGLDYYGSRYYDQVAGVFLSNNYGSGGDKQ